MIRNPYLINESGKRPIGYKEPPEITLISRQRCFYRQSRGGEHLDPTDSYRLIGKCNKCYPISLDRPWLRGLSLRVFARVHK